MMVLMTEEKSMEKTLSSLIRRQFPQAEEGVDWIVLAFEGKQDLEKRFVDRLKIWSYGDPHFVVMRDADSGDCSVIKARLLERAQPYKRKVTVRIVCKELESWFIGDEKAVKSAYPEAKLSSATEKYRDPDGLLNASQELSKITGDSSKVGRAGRTAAHMQPESNRSKGFQVTFATLEGGLSGNVGDY